jgi:hypothetical protein
MNGIIQFASAHNVSSSNQQHLLLKKRRKLEILQHCLEEEMVKVDFNVKKYSLLVGRIITLTKNKLILKL